MCVSVLWSVQVLESDGRQSTDLEEDVVGRHAELAAVQHQPFSEQ